MARNYDLWKEQGITPIDRPVAPESFETVRRIKNALRPKVEQKRRAEIRPQVGGLAIIHLLLTVSIFHGLQ